MLRSILVRSALFYAVNFLHCILLVARKFLSTSSYCCAEKKFLPHSVGSDKKFSSKAEEVKEDVSTLPTKCGKKKFQRCSANVKIHVLLNFCTISVDQSGRYFSLHSAVSAELIFTSFLLLLWKKTSQKNSMLKQLEKRFQCYQWNAVNENFTAKIANRCCRQIDVALKALVTGIYYLQHKRWTDKLFGS